jgi:membrane protein
VKFLQLPWVAHILRAWKQLKANNGTQYSAAITYFSFLALFPLLLLAVAVTGFVLHSHPHLQQELFDKVLEQAPGSVGVQLKSSINSLISARRGVGVIGLVGVFITGLGWIGNLRQAINAVWGYPPLKRTFLATKLSNLGVLAGLGLGIVISLGLTVAGTALTDQILRWLGLDNVTGSQYLVRILGLLLAVLGDMIIFGWMLVRLPNARVSRTVAVRGVILAAVGFEALKVAGTYTIAESAHSPTLGPFAGLLAVLIWIELVSRFLLFSSAWIATADPEPVPLAPADRVEAVIPEPVPTPLRVAVPLVAAGAAVGAAAVVWLQDRRSESG